jgi:hypothetical protein
LPSADLKQLWRSCARDRRKLSRRSNKSV